MTVEQLRQLEQAAVRAPWWVVGDGDYPQYVMGNDEKARDPEPGDVLVAETYMDPHVPPHDAELIAAMRNVFPALLDIAEAAESIARVACEWHCYGDCDRCRLRAALSRLDTEGRHG